jgi:Aspartyl protease/PDZ domain
LTRLAFELLGNKPLVPVRVDGRGPYAFLLDNGSSYDVVDSAVAKELGLTVTPFEAQRGAGEGTIESGTADDVVFGLNGAEFPAGRIVVMPLSEAIGPGGGRRVDGLLGYPFFSLQAVELCYDGSEVEVYDRSPRGWPGVRIPIEIDHEHALTDATLELRDGRRVTGRFMLDTAFRNAIMLTRPFAEEHAIADSFPRARSVTTGWGIGGPMRDVVGRAIALELGSLRFEQPIVTCSTARAGVLSEASFAGIIGGELLRRCHTLIDYRRREVVLEPSNAWDEPHELDQSGLYLIAEGTDFGRFVVHDVIPDSPAANVGIAPGDELLEIAGHDLRSLQLEELRALLRAGPGTTYLLRFERAGEVRLTLRRLV